MKNSKRIYSVFLLIIFLVSCKGQEPSDQPKGSKNQIENALLDSVSSQVDSNATSTPYGPTRITRSIRQDSKGNILLATYEGIIQYDGNSFTNLTKKAGLSDCAAFDVLEDKAGNIWIATDHDGAYRYDGASFTHFTTKAGLAHNRLFKIYEDNTGNIWFSTIGGASRYNPATDFGTGSKPFTNFTSKEGLTNNDVNSIIEVKPGQFWISTRGEACVYDGKTFATLTNKEGATFNNIHSIIEDHKGNIWLGGSEGLWRYNGSSFTNITTVNVSGVFEDKKGNIWITHDSGESHKYTLSRYDEASLLNEKPTATQVFIDNGMFFGISEDKEGGIWVGTLQGVFRYDGKSFNYFRDKGG